MGPLNSLEDWAGFSRSLANEVKRCSRMGQAVCSPLCGYQVCPFIYPRESLAVKGNSKKEWSKLDRRNSDSSRGLFVYQETIDHNPLYQYHC